MKNKMLSKSELQNRIAQADITGLEHRKQFGSKSSTLHGMWWYSPSGDGK